MKDFIKKLGDMIAQKQRNNIIEDVENTIDNMELVSGKDLMTIIIKYDIETANKVFEIYKKNQKDNGVNMTYGSGKNTTSKTQKTSTPSYSSSCGSSSGSCGSSFGYSSYSGGCGCSSSRC